MAECFSVCFSVCQAARARVTILDRAGKVHAGARASVRVHMLGGKASYAYAGVKASDAGVKASSWSCTHCFSCVSWTQPSHCCSLLLSMQDSAVARVEGFGSRRFSRSHLFDSLWPVRNSASASLKKGICLALASFDRLAATVQASAKGSKPPPVATTLNNPSAMEVKRSSLATRCPSSVSWLRGIALKCGYLKLFAFWA